MENGFTFKQFVVRDDKSSMKVGTDAVILGSWVNTNLAKTILDIGTGSGIIALMMAQRSSAAIDAIDIDPASAEQAKQNFEASEWNVRLSIFHCSLQEYKKKQEKKYDLIITNPPYFNDSLHSPDKNRNIARHNNKLSFEELIICVNDLLSQDGRFALILPVIENTKFREKAFVYGLFPLQELFVYPKKGKEVNRICTEFSFKRSLTVEKNSLTIRNDDNTFTPDYIDLTKEFYLAF